DDLADLDAGPLADAVDRPRGDVTHARVPDVQVHEHVVRHAVAGIDAIEIELFEDLAARRGVPRLRVRDVPVAGCDLRQEREHRVTEIARAWNHAPGL